ncbi:MAG TPA: hypothetical protein DER40_10185 [Geobacter sp.]|nr:MAG: hypothetical protein A2X85_02235 [Geobacteraceae bacterium GWF2_54_21]HBA71181.1 hypothetical protein [Geobacter sp.]HCE67863.1 hypothetical protein [Geobacter sp.]
MNCEIPNSAVWEFIDIVDKISGQGQRWYVLEHFKSHFGNSSRSSTESWAESDLRSAMTNAAMNAPLFIEAFVNACDSLKSNGEGWFAPDAALINTVLAKHKIGYEIRPPDLVARELGSTPIPVTIATPTIAEMAKEMIERSLSRSEELLSEGRPREAVQEILWLLETVATAFRGLETESGKVEGKYFNHIVRDLRAKHPGSTLERILDWATAMHGYLSSPKGGGVRHGIDLNGGIALDLNEARLFCNLTRSYISFLIMEHENVGRL